MIVIDYMIRIVQLLRDTALNLYNTSISSFLSNLKLPFDIPVISGLFNGLISTINTLFSNLGFADVPIVFAIPMILITIGLAMTLIKVILSFFK